MFKLKVLLLTIGILSLVCGVKFIYDARPIVKKYFSFGDKNEATLGLKMFGFLLMIIGGIIIFYHITSILKKNTLNLEKLSTI